MFRGTLDFFREVWYSGFHGTVYQFGTLDSGTQIKDTYYGLHGEDENKETEAVPTSYNPNYIGLGSVIFINEKGYKVVEIKDDAYVVVTFDALPDEDVADLNALYAKLFTPEQQKLVKNMGQLLDSEDVLTIFGKPGNHPVFEFQKDLVK